MTTQERCGICEAANRDLGILLGGRSATSAWAANENLTQAYARLGPWVTHVRVLGPNARGHVDGLKLSNLSGTAYLRNVLQAVGNPKLEDPVLLAMRRSLQDELIASALVLLVTGAHIWPVGAHRGATERIAKSWGWGG